jgi:glycosyltransferase involved in cell wall biosynthesis
VRADFVNPFYKLRITHYHFHLMKIGLIAHGALPIPPVGWGAVEGTLWHRKLHLERMGHTVDISNIRAIDRAIDLANKRAYDFVHCHNEDFVAPCVSHLKWPLAVTSHHGWLHAFDPGLDHDHSGKFGRLSSQFRETMRAPANFVLSERIRQMYVRCGYTGFLRVLRNAVEAGEFRVVPRGNGKAVCVGAISRRKRQKMLFEIARDRVHVDFVGPWGLARAPGPVEHEHAAYLGVWDKPTLYERLGEYSCLVLLSESEGAPKVVLEGLAAGLSVVITEACAANLTDEEFITIIPDGETRPDTIAHAIQSAIDNNPTLRATIRDYAFRRFDYSVVVPEYVRLIEEYLSTRRLLL